MQIPYNHCWLSQNSFLNFCWTFPKPNYGCNWWVSSSDKNVCWYSCLLKQQTFQHSLKLHLPITDVNKIFPVLLFLNTRRIFPQTFWLFTIICITNILSIVSKNLNNQQNNLSSPDLQQCQVPECKFSHLGWFQATNVTSLNTGLGRDVQVTYHFTVFLPCRYNRCKSP